MKKRAFLLAAIVAFLFTSCQKQPDASFTTDKSSYVAGETIHLKNTSQDADSYLWTMPDGQTSATRDVDYTLQETTPAGSLTFKLEAFSKNEKKDDEAQATVNVTAATGNAVFWQAIGSGFGITVVTVDGVSSNITAEYSGAPPCGTAGCAVFNGLEVGTYPFTASDGSTNWSGNVTITKDGCTTMQLY